MLSQPPLPDYKPGQDFFYPAETEESQRIRDTYPKSGLYRNDGSRTLLWEVDWYRGGVEVPSDGKHLIRFGSWARSPDDEAFSFFENGKLIRTYRIAELVDRRSIMTKYQPYLFFVWLEDRKFDDSKMELSIRTIDGNRFTFDVATGEMIGSLRPDKLIRHTAAGIEGLLIGAATIALAWQMVRNRRVKPRIA
jgi:hypothetical protein